MPATHRSTFTPATARATTAHGRPFGVPAATVAPTASAASRHAPYPAADFADLSPITRAFIGSLRGASADTEEYIDHLARKHA